MAFHNINANSLLTLGQQFSKAVKEGGWAGQVSLALDLLTNGGWSDMALSPQFTNAFNAAEAIFAGWAGVANVRRLQPILESARRPAYYWYYGWAPVLRER